MSAAAVVVILIAAGDAGDPSTAALTRATREALGPDAVVVVQEVEPSADARTIGKKLNADAVASVTWTMSDRRRAHVVVLNVSDGRMTERDVDFVAGDQPAERGRAIGLTIVAMVPERAPEPPPAAPPAIAPSRPRDPAPPPSAAPPRFGVDAFAVGATGPLGVGGGVGARYLGWIAPRISASLRSARVADDATLRALDVAVGIAPQLIDGRTTLGARAELGVTRHSVSFGDAARARWVPHARVLGEVAFFGVPSVGIGVAAGFEMAFGETRVLVNDAVLGAVPRARAVVELTLRARW